MAALHLANETKQKNDLIRWVYFCLFCFVSVFVFLFFLHSQCLVLAGQSPVSGQLSLAHLVAAYENHSRKPLAQVTDTFFAYRGCPLTRASTVLVNS